MLYYTVLSYDISQESYVILLKNRRHIAVYVYLICILFNLQMDYHIVCMASSQIMWHLRLYLLSLADYVWGVGTG